MGHKDFNLYAIDCMLGTVSLVYYLLFNIILNLFNIDVWNNFYYFVLSSENNNNTGIVTSNYTDTQSAENCEGFSDTISQLYKDEKENIKFYHWLAGIIDGDGNFDIRKVSNKLKLKTIRIKLHNRDIRILTRILDYLHIGRIRSDKKKLYSIFIVSTKEEMKFLINKLNGLIRIKIDGFKKSCEYLNINYIEADYNIKPGDPYFSGLIDTDGSIVYNYSGNRIECNLEFKENEYSKKLNLSKTIPNCEPYIIRRTHKNSNNIYYSIAFKYQNVNHMIHIYDYFM